MKEKIGIYLGVNSVAAVSVTKKVISQHAVFDLETLDKEARAEDISEEIRWEALVNKTLREINAAEEKDVRIAITDQDIIYRSFELPLMKKREVEASLSFEAEKYMPFKMDELLCDYKFVSVAKEKKINLSFVAIREDVYGKYKEMFQHLNKNASAIMPASSLLVGVVKSLPKFKQWKTFVLVEYSGQELGVAFFKDNLPVFNRFVNLRKRNSDSETIIEQIRIALEYFKREFKEAELEGAIILANTDDAALFASVDEDLGIKSELVIPGDIVGIEELTVEELKAYAIATSDIYRSVFKPRFRKLGVSQLEEKEISVALNVNAIGAVVGAALVSGLFIFLFMSNRISMVQAKITLANKRLHIPQALKGKDNSQLKRYEKAIEKRMKAINQRLQVKKQINTVFEAIPKAVSEGMWLDSLSVSETKVKKGYKIVLSGYIYLADSYQERTSLNNFMATLARSDYFKQFNSINLVSSERRKLRQYEVTFFKMELQ